MGNVSNAQGFQKFIDWKECDPHSILGKLIGAKRLIENQTPQQEIAKLKMVKIEEHLELVDRTLYGKQDILDSSLENSCG